VARHSVAELWGASQHPAAAPGGALVRVPTGQLPAVRQTDALERFVEGVPVSPRAMILGGLGLALLGIGLGASVLSAGFVGVVLIGGMVTFGGGVAVLGMRKLRTPPPVAASPAVDPHVLAERARRVHAVLAQGGAMTFEGLLARLRWMERALVEALVAMKDSGDVMEDLDLDTGEWVYRLQYGEAIGTPASLTLADRQHHPERA